MSFGKSEKAIVTFSTALLLLSGGYYYYSEFLNEEVKEAKTKVEKGEVIASIESIKPVVKVKSEGEVRWRGARRGLKLYSKDSVFTQRNAAAKIRYKNDVVIDLEPNTLVKIEQNQNQFDLGLEKGFISLNTKKNNNIKLRMGSKAIDIASGNANLQIRNDGLGSPDIVALGGSAKFKLGEKELLVKKGRRLLVSEDGQNISVANEYIALSSPEAGSKVELSFDDPLTFTWESNLKDADYQVEISENISFGDPLLPDVTKEKNLRFNKLNPGKYYWRVRSKFNNENIYSAIFQFEITGAEVPILNEKEIAMNLSNKEEREVLIGWKGGEGWSYHIEFYQKEGNYSKIFKSDVNVFKWKAPSPNAEYFYKIRGDKPRTEWSKQGKINTIYKNFLANLMPNQSFIDPKVFANGITFSWSGNKDDKYSIKITRDKDLKDIITEMKDIVGTEQYVSFRKEEIKSDRIYWNVTSVDYPSEVSKTAEVTISKPVAELLSPLDQEIEIKNVKDKVFFKWELLEGVSPDNVIIQLATDEEFTTFENIEIGDEFREGYPYNFKKSGQYFWKIKYVGKTNGIMHTEAGRFQVRRPGDILPPKIYKKYDLQYRVKRGKELYLIEWGESKETEAYVLEVFKDLRLTDLVLRKKLEKNYYIWEGRTSGQFFYRIQSIGTKGRLSPFSSIGRLIFPIAPLAD